MPRLRRLAAAGFQARVDPVLPAVTCSVQSTFLTGLEPTDHGIVGNGWYFRDLGEVFLWRQHNALVQGEKVWETARRAKPGFKVANVCWWYAMGASTDLTVTPRPIYFADGKKEPDCYTWPPALHDRLTGALGEFPLFTYWGPTANITSSRWIAQASRKLLDEEELDLLLVYLPHLDYDHQRFGPAAAESAAAAAAELDDVAGELVEHAQGRGDTVVVLSEYGITDARRPIDVNRALRRAGLLEVYTQAGMEYLDPWASRAFAVADHQIAHVYVQDPADLQAARDALAGLRGVDVALEGDARRDAGLGHERVGRDRARRRARRLVHLLLLARRRARARLRRAPWRSTASPATTPPSCSSTRRTSCAKPKAGATLRAQEARASATRCRSSRSTRRACAARTAGCRTVPTTRRCCCAPTPRSRATGSRRPTCGTCCSSSRA